jgi:hypothetical protein
MEAVMEQTPRVDLPHAEPLLIAVVGVPAAVSAYPVHLALASIGFGPSLWVSISWQLASVVAWGGAAAVVLAVLRRRTARNTSGGLSPVSLPADGGLLLRLMAMTTIGHAAILTLASNLLLMGRGRPAIPTLFTDVLLLYAPGSLLLMLGLIALAIVAAEHRSRLGDVAARTVLEGELASARQQVAAAMADLNGTPPAPQAGAVAGAPLTRIPVTIGDRTVLVDVATIDWIEAESYYARLHVANGSYLVRQTMAALESRLDSRQFARIHRSTIVNLDRVVEVRPHDRRSYLVTLRDGRRLMMSRRRRQLLEFLFA